MVQLVVYSDQLMTDTYISHIENFKEEEIQSHVIHFSPWHASHALKSEYTTLLHSHKLSSLALVGPGYEVPGASGEIMYAAKEIRRQGTTRHYYICEQIERLTAPNT